MKFQLKEAKNLPNKLFLPIEASFFLAKVTNGDIETEGEDDKDKIHMMYIYHQTLELNC